MPLNGASNQELHSPLPHTCDQQDFKTTYVLSGPELRHDVKYLNSRASSEIGHRLNDPNIHPLGAGVDGGNDTSLSVVMNRLTDVLVDQRNRLPEVIIEKFNGDPVEYDLFVRRFDDTFVTPKLFVAACICQLSLHMLKLEGNLTAGLGTNISWHSHTSRNWKVGL